MRGGLGLNDGANIIGHVVKYNWKIWLNHFKELDLSFVLNVMIIILIFITLISKESLHTLPPIPIVKVDKKFININEISWMSYLYQMCIDFSKISCLIIISNISTVGNIF